ncbi:hypothetical protein ABW19_dt0208718 [Dactylella cylindrospora]|nr:hypothetical protein ABW19_dt0208718 [Dactylella cylindrospora]
MARVRAHLSQCVAGAMEEMGFRFLPLILGPLIQLDILTSRLPQLLDHFAIIDQFCPECDFLFMEFGRIVDRCEGKLADIAAVDVPLFEIRWLGSLVNVFGGEIGIHHGDVIGVS